MCGYENLLSRPNEIINRCIGRSAGIEWPNKIRDSRERKELHIILQWMNGSAVGRAPIPVFIPSAKCKTNARLRLGNWNTLIERQFYFTYESVHLLFEQNSMELCGRNVFARVGAMAVAVWLSRWPMCLLYAVAIVFVG